MFTCSNRDAQSARISWYPYQRGHEVSNFWGHNTEIDPLLTVRDTQFHFDESTKLFRI